MLRSHQAPQGSLVLSTLIFGVESLSPMCDWALSCCWNAEFTIRGLWGSAQLLQPCASTVGLVCFSTPKAQLRYSFGDLERGNELYLHSCSKEGFSLSMFLKAISLCINLIGVYQRDSSGDVLFLWIPGFWVRFPTLSSLLLEALSLCGTAQLQVSRGLRLNHWAWACIPSPPVPMLHGPGPVSSVVSLWLFKGLLSSS